MKCLSFEIIEDSRFESRPKIEEQIESVSHVLSDLEWVEFSISKPRFITWAGTPDGDVHQRRSVAHVYYELARDRKTLIMIAVNAVIPAPYYYQ